MYKQRVFPVSKSKTFCVPSPVIYHTPGSENPSNLQQKYLQKKEKILLPLYFPSILPLVLPRCPAVDAGNGRLSIKACPPPRRKATSVHVCSAFSSTPDGVIEAVHFFIADGTLVGERLAPARVGTRC